MLEEEWVKNGPFAGVIAFSMGGCVATVMAALPGRFPGCKFVVTAGSPDIDLDSLLKSNVCQKFPSDGHIPMGLASFHFAGLQDSAVPAQASRNLSLKYNPLKCIFVEHEQGHCFPSKAILNDQCVNFIKRYAHSDAVVSAAPIATVVVPSVEPVTDFEKNPSPEDMVAQFEELEVLSVIYPEDISLLPELGSDSVDIADYIAAGKRTGREVISIQLSPLEGTDSLMPSKWKGQFKILVKRPYNYPSAAAPVVELGLGTLSLHDVSTSLQRSLLQSIDDVARENVGEASIMSCVQAANDWLCTHNSSSIFASAEAKHDAVTVTVAAEAVEPELRLLGEDDTSEDATSEMIRNVSLLAGQLIAKIRRNGIRADTSCYSLSGPSSDAKGSAIELSASARGAWNYTVGLVGKPSAGKSTFYNVATRAVLSRDGRLMAAVASHPFTTIEPNVGPGWWLSPVDESISDTSITCDAAHRGARYGRDKNGGRYLPLIVKDVAGLVPGAYKGRGIVYNCLIAFCHINSMPSIRKRKSISWRSL